MAESFARIFYRAAINQGLLLIECPEAVRAFKPGDEVTLSPARGEVMLGSHVFHFHSLPPEILAIRDAGGLLPYTRTRLKTRRC